MQTDTFIYILIMINGRCIDNHVHMYAIICMKIMCLLLCSPYDGKWSKTMIGYGPEDNHFVMELTYNYGIKQYKRGNDFQVKRIIGSAKIVRNNPPCICYFVKI